MFTPDHFLWIGLCLLFLFGMTLFCKKQKVTLKTAGLIMTGICAFSELSKIFSNLLPSPTGGMHLDPLALPFHLCSLMLFGIFFITFGKDGHVKQTLIDFIAVLGTLGSICAILIPTNGTDFASLLSYQCFVYHGGLLWFSLYLILHRHAHLDWRAYLRNLAVMLCLVVAMLYVNSILSVYDTNFMYLVRPPLENLPYLNLDKGWYVYFLHIIVLGLAAISLFQLPFLLRNLKKKKGLGT